jgi:hypothetical protein
MLCTHLRLAFPSGLLFSPVGATCLAHIILLDMIILIILDEGYNSRSSLLCSFLYSPVTSSLFGPNIPLSILFSNTLSLYSSLNIRDRVSHIYIYMYMYMYVYRTTDNIIVLFTLIFKIFDSKREDISFWTEPLVCIYVYIY